MSCNALTHEELLFEAKEPTSFDVHLAEHGLGGEELLEKLSKWATHEHALEEERCRVKAPRHMDAKKWKIPLVYVYDDNHLRSFLQSVKREYFARPWPSGDKYYTEIALHEQLLASGCRTRDAFRADIFFVPFYGTYALEQGKINQLHSLIHRLFTEDINAIGNLAKRHGRDHAIVYSSTRPFRKIFPSKLVRLLQNTQYLTVEKDDARAKSRMPAQVRSRSILMPFYVSNVTHGAPFVPVNNNSGKYSLTFIGNPRIPFRIELRDRFSPTAEHLDLDSDEEKFVRNSSIIVQKKMFAKGEGIMTLGDFTQLQLKASQMLSESSFCAVTCGTTPTTTRLYEALANGCIPVILCDKMSELPFQRQINYDLFTLRYSQKCLAELPSILSKIDLKGFLQLRIHIHKLRRHLLWQDEYSSVTERILMELQSKQQ